MYERRKGYVAILLADQNMIKIVSNKNINLTGSRIFNIEIFTKNHESLLAFCKSVGVINFTTATILS